MASVSRGTPGCALVGLAALLPVAIGCAGVYGIALWLRLPVETRQFNGPFWYAAASAVLGPLVAILLLRLAVNVWRNTDFRGYDPSDPKDRGIKW